MKNIQKSFVSSLVMLLVILFSFSAVGASEMLPEEGTFYTVDFYHGGNEYHLTGGGSMMLSALLSELGIHGEAQSAQFSNPALLSVTPAADGFLLTSLNPFTTTERLTVTLQDQNIIEIIVEDDIANGNFNGVYWWLTEDGTLNIRPLTSVSSQGGADIAHREDLRDWPWNDYRSQVTKIQFALNGNGISVGVRSGVSINRMFENMTNLTEVTGLENFDISKAGGIARMFAGCTSLTELDLSSFTNTGKMYNMQNLFNGCTNLKKVTLNNAGFVTRGAPGNGTGVLIANMFANCPALEVVDMSNITLYQRDNGENEFKELFKGRTSLKTVKMDNIKLPAMKDLSSMFEGCTALQKVSMTGSIDLNSAEYMTAMFKGCTALTDLNVSGFGNLPSIINMDDFVRGCTALETLNMDNLDNSNIGPYCETHSISEDDHPCGIEYGRELGLRSCTSLQKLSVQNSRIWMVKNNKGMPGQEYYNVSNDSDILWWWPGMTDAPGDNGTQLIYNGTALVTKRDYVDQISWGNLDADAGFLKEGVYEITSDKWVKPEFDLPDTYYRIAYIGKVPYKVDIKKGGSELVKVDGANNTWINTVSKTAAEWGTSGDYPIDCDIDIIYENAAIDVNGKLHDIIINITKITFKDLEKIPQNQGRTHDGNKYYDTDGGGSYYRSILQATRNDGVTFRNYVKLGNPNTPTDNPNALSGGSGTDITFTVKIDKANEGTSFLFHGEDLDVAQAQNWNRPNNDACYDNLPFTNVTYGAGGEGFVLGSNVETSPVFADKTGLKLENNAVVTTGSDPDTSWSEFYVKVSDAKAGGTFTWTSGIACTTYALRNTPPNATGSMQLKLLAEKRIIGGKEPLKADDFTFTLTDVSVTPSGAPAAEGITLPVTVGNKADGSIDFGTLTFAHDHTSGQNSTIYNSDKEDYYPGTSPSGNDSGDGTHNTFTYKYTVKENLPEPQDPLAFYDTTVRNVEINIKTPENDAEMEKGIRAEIVVDGETVADEWYKKDDEPVEVTLTTFENQLPFELKITPTVTKTVRGANIPTDAQYQFTLTPNTQGAPMPAGATITVSGAGTGRWGELVFNKVGKYTYTIQEVKGQIPDCTYDSSRYTVTYDITLKDNAPEYTKTITKNGEEVDSVTFENIYPTPVDVEPSIKKILTGVAPSTAETYVFTLEGISPSNVPMPAGASGKTATIRITGEGEGSFGTITLPKQGTYIYRVRETKGNNTDCKYDTSIYNIQYDVDIKGNLTTKITKDGTTEVEVISFENIYPTPVDGEIGVTKTVTGNVPAKAETFSFVLEGASGMPMPAGSDGQKKTIQITGAGEASFGPITFPRDGTYTYTIRETPGSTQGCAYDTSVYTVVWKVTNGDYVQTISIDGKTVEVVEFVNDYEGYKPVNPKANPEVEKTVKDGKPAAEDVFEFYLREVSNTAGLPENPMPEGSKNGEKYIEVNGEGRAEFGEIEFPRVGEYVYEIAEVPGEDSKYDYDPAVYSVTWTVSEVPDFDELQVELSVLKDGKEYDNEIFVFENRVLPELPIVNPAVKKVVSGGTPGVKEKFIFTLTGISNTIGQETNPMPDGSDENVKTIEITGSGSVHFGEIEFPADGEYVYEVAETPGNSVDYEYDSTVYTVTYVVEGTTVSAEINKDGKKYSGKNFEFENIYGVGPYSVNPTVKKIIDGKPKEKATFTFRLTALTNTAGLKETPMPKGSEKGVKDIDIRGAGEKGFGGITFTVPGRYLYRIQEIPGDEAGYTYDTAVYTVTYEVTEDEEGDGLKVKTIVSRDKESVDVKKFEFTNKFQGGSPDPGPGGGGSSSTLPRTGFAPGRVTKLHPLSVGYDRYDRLYLRVPALGVETEIMGVPLVDGDWDVSWLGDNVGWLQNTAYPGGTGAGNTVITGHSINYLGRPGIFSGLEKLGYGSPIIITAYGETFTYTVKEVLTVFADTPQVMSQKTDLPELTLITCKYFNEKTGEYDGRVVVKAVLAEVSAADSAAFGSF